MSSLQITIKQGDITEERVDAIVNPANSYGYMGGGVAGALKEKGGIEIEQEACSHAPIPVGSAVVTKGGLLTAEHVIHAPTMEQPGARIIDVGIIKEATLAALQCADEQGFGKIAMPGMGTGVGGMDFEKAAAAIIDALVNFEAEHLKEIVLVDQNKEMVDAFHKVFHGT